MKKKMGTGFLRGLYSNGKLEAQTNRLLGCSML